MYDVAKCKKKLTFASYILVSLFKKMCLRWTEIMILLTVGNHYYFILTGRMNVFIFLMGFFNFHTPETSLNKQIIIVK